MGALREPRDDGELRQRRLERLARDIAVDGRRRQAGGLHLGRQRGHVEVLEPVEVLALRSRSTMMYFSSTTFSASYLKVFWKP